MDNLCVNVRKVNKGEKQPFTIKLFQNRTDESKLPVLSQYNDKLEHFSKLSIGKDCTHNTKFESICHLEELTKNNID